MANEDKKPEVKKPKFNAYWIYASIIIIIIGAQIFGGGSLSQPSQTTETDFQEYLINGDVEKIEIVNRKLAKVYLTQEAKSKEVHI
ncbi:MAG: peptidase M41, partial [Flavobacteriaceae bacterium]|nr:peptidase M41 [Flavobacteriaceae bacterium]